MILEEEHDRNDVKEELTDTVILLDRYNALLEFIEELAFNIKNYQYEY